jgi:hypothetical protein
MIAAMAITFESSGARATSNLSHAPGFTDQVPLGRIVADSEAIHMSEKSPI